MKYLYLSMFMLIFGLGLANAQLVRLPKPIYRLIADKLYEQKSVFESKRSNSDTLFQYCFILKFKVKHLSSDSVAVLAVSQMEGEKAVPHLSDVGFLKNINFAGISKDKKINTINIPCFYSIVDRIKMGSERINSYYNFWENFDALLVRDRRSENEIFTEPVTIFGTIYE